MAVADDLKAARDLIADPARWTREANARDVEGRPIDPSSTDAVCWCLEGVLQAVKASDEAIHILENACKEIAGKDWTFPIIVTNDELGHPAVMQALDLAIFRAGEPL